MTEHTKIPLPQSGPQGEDDDAPSASLIERAAERFDFRRFVAPAVPVPPESATRRATERLSHERKEAKASALNSYGDEPLPDRSHIAPVRPASFSAEQAPIDRELLRANGFIDPEGSVTALLEEFRIVKRQLLLRASQLMRQEPTAKNQRVLISSPHPGEGKTYCAVNLALSIAAERDSDVLLVDADFAKPSILSALGLPSGPGLMDALMDETLDVADLVLGTDIPGLWVLPAGNTSTSDSEYLSSVRTERVLERLTQNAPKRTVIFDSPPALAASPAAELAKHVGQVVVIVRADSTGQGALEDAVSLLSSCPNMELLLNAAQFSPSGRRFGSYYGYSE
ncbi:AAA family ATPase [Novosphingobium sp. M1R2S20]|uniref:AAA family ATPase n=1 Tax=Novosphingobium rhizovicinum TaxID=3228928 RepID=A0ABV3RFR6_9SPHN